MPRADAGAPPREGIDSLCRTALEHFGLASQLNKTIQECGELLVAITRFQEQRPNAKENLIEEIADVRIMVRQLSHVFGLEEVDAAEQAKLRRLKERIRSDRAGEGDKAKLIGERINGDWVGNSEGG